MELHARQDTLIKELDELRYKIPECKTLYEYDMIHLQIAFYKDLLQKYNPVPRYKENRVNEPKINPGRGRSQTTGGGRVTSY